jgi:HJR/Mrr/RecB family endonuclease
MKDASAKTFRATLIFDQEIADIGEELIKEAKGKGIAVLANRNQRRVS